MNTQLPFINHSHKIPQFRNVTLQAAFDVVALMVANVMAHRQVELQSSQVLFLSMLFVTMVYQHDWQRSEAITQTFEIGRRGVMGNAFPKQENLQCAHRLCNGAFNHDSCESTSLLRLC